MVNAGLTRDLADGPVADGGVKPSNERTSLDRVRGGIGQERATGPNAIWAQTGNGFPVGTGSHSGNVRAAYDRSGGIASLACPQSVHVCTIGTVLMFPTYTVSTRRAAAIVTAACVETPEVIA